jgi:cold shock CspA family protein
MRKTGVLNVWFADRNYGFIHEQQDSAVVSHFLHASNIIAGTPKSGATVTFQSLDSAKGSLAVNAEVQS